MKVPKTQWQLPITTDIKGNWITLEEFHKNPNIGISLTNLSAEAKAILVAERIRRQPSFEISTITDGTIYKNKAIEEVTNRTALGNNLIAIESTVILHLIENLESLESC